MSEENSAFPIAPLPKPSKFDGELEAQRAQSGGFGEWLKKNPMPDLQALVELRGGYDKITEQDWREFEARLEGWKRAHRLRNSTRPTSTS